jgi:glyceraldehyde-3-phosphate dehydrogenase (NADP+)
MEKENSKTGTLPEIFKEESRIPQEYKIPEIHQRVYLLNGALVPWEGPFTNIYSPVCIPTENGL